jgi:retinol dehydrogenase-12
VSQSLDPGNLKTDLWKHLPSWQGWLINRGLKEPIYGAYTELYAGISTDITQENNGAFGENFRSFSTLAHLLIQILVVPWGQIGSQREDIEQSIKSKAEGGTGVAEEFWDWTEEQVKLYL